jgi:hypothetical protein
MEPRPRRPSNGKGEAVWGRFEPAFWSAGAALFCALTSELDVLVELLGAAALLCAFISELEVAVELLLGAAALLCALISELLVLLLGGVVELVAVEEDGVWLELLMLLWSEVVVPWLPTPLELAA